MTDKTKMSNLESYQELTIQISTLNLKLDKILSLLNKPEVTIDDIKTIGAQPGHGASYVDVIEYLSKPPQWPNESRTDYLKRIGQYNEASSDNENFEDSYK